MAVTVSPMRYLAVVVTALALVGCDSASYADSPPAQCLVQSGWHDSGDGRTFLKNGHDAITLAEFDGVVQPVTEQDLRDYVEAGCL